MINSIHAPSPPEKGIWQIQYQFMIKNCQQTNNIEEFPQLYKDNLF